MSSSLAYTTRSGDEPSAAADVLIEHKVPRTMRVTDSRYGLKTVARLEHEKKQRDEFNQTRREALVRDRAKIEDRLVNLRADVHRITLLVTSGKVTGKARIEDAITKVERLAAAEAKMVADIERLNGKIGVCK